MMTNSLNFTVNASSAEDIRTHLTRCDHQFSPRLSERVDIGEYAKKIKDKAFTFDAWERDTLIGLVAAYMNSAERSCYITNVSVMEGFSGRGIAAKLLNACFEQAESSGISAFLLEVSGNNHPAIRLYEKFGFKVIEKSHGSLLMLCKRGHSEDVINNNEAEL